MSDKQHSFLTYGMQIYVMFTESAFGQTAERSLALEKRCLSMFQHHVTIKQSNLPG